MLKKYSHLFEGLFIASDLIVASLAWVASYWIRFGSGLIPVEKGVPVLSDYLRMLIFVWLIWAFVFRRFGLYRPMRGVSRLRESWRVVRANSLSVVLLLAVTYLFREKNVEFSRLVFVIFFALSTTLAVLSRSGIRAVLRSMRRRGHNLRYALIVGTGELASNIAKRIRAHPEYGIELFGCLASDEDLAPTGNRSLRLYTGAGSPRWYRSSAALRPKPIETIRPQLDPELPVIGTYSDLPHILERVGIDQVIVALPFHDHVKIEQVVSSVGDSMADIRIVPDIHRFIMLGSQIEELDGLPIVSVASTPLAGVNRVLKRAFDLVFASLFLVMTAPLMALTAVLVKLTSRGPVLFQQERMGLDGRLFRIFKFRTMYIDAEKTGARFAVRNDPRVTPIGRFLRRFSIDELPQLFNVLRGQMSLVGPRPERPVFIDEFRGRIPRYMLRHKVQAGMTGWAQVNGWRGNTSIQRRIEHDLYYIEKWSLLLDLKILVLTIVTALFDRNAY